MCQKHSKSLDICQEYMYKEDMSITPNWKKKDKNGKQRYESKEDALKYAIAAVIAMGASILFRDKLFELDDKKKASKKGKSTTK